MAQTLEQTLTEFIDTLDLSLKSVQRDMGSVAGISSLTLSQFQYIDAIYTLGEPSLTEIADKLAFTKASVTTAVNKLAELNYLVKTRSEDDRRVFHVSLTAKGASLVKAKQEALQNYGVFIRSALSKGEAEQLEQLLGKLTKLFGRP